MEGGLIVKEGPAEQLQEDSAIVEAYLGRRNTAEKPQPLI
jgi:ABC-type uncharacterized transport system ATPase subunit